jgi:hypothetical protein
MHWRGCPWTLFFLLITALRNAGVSSIGDNKSSSAPLFCAFRCVASQGYLRSTSHPTLGSVLTATRNDYRRGQPQLILADIAFEVQDAMSGGWIYLRYAYNQRFVSLIRPPEKPAWVVPVVDKQPRPEGLFRIEHVGGAWFIFSNYTGGYINCIDGGLIRGHGYFPRNNLPATREPSTEFEIVALDATLVKHSLIHPSEVEIVSNDAGRSMISANVVPASPLPSTAKLSVDSRASTVIPSMNSRTTRKSADRRDECKRNCRWPYDEAKGYPTTAFSGALADYVCPSMFRDLADYVFKWPFSHFKEKVATTSPNVAASCLPPVPIIYCHAGSISDLTIWAKKSLRRPFILVTGQSDFPVSRMKRVLNDPNLVTWFAQNSDMTHPKLVPIPIGLNCFEHAPEMHQALRLLKSTGPQKRDKLVLVNFGNTHPSRKVVWEHFCGKNSVNRKFATCSIKSQRNNIQGNPHLVGYYKKVAAHKFVIAPRGNGWDTHRLWEALYLGCVPIVESSVLDELYSHLPILIVKSWGSLNEKTLENMYERFLPRLKFQERLHRHFWWSVFESYRTKALLPHHTEGNNSRYRCWG